MKEATRNFYSFGNGPRVWTEVIAWIQMISGTYGLIVSIADGVLFFQELGATNGQQQNFQPFNTLLFSLSELQSFFMWGVLFSLGWIFTGLILLLGIHQKSSIKLKIHVAFSTIFVCLGCALIINFLQTTEWNSNYNSGKGLYLAGCVLTVIATCLSIWQVNSYRINYLTPKDKLRESNLEEYEHLRGITGKKLKNNRDDIRLKDKKHDYFRELLEIKKGSRNDIPLMWVHSVEGEYCCESPVPAIKPVLGTNV